MRLFQFSALLFGAMLAGQTSAHCDDMPWKFGMSPTQVSAFTECGPYKTFKNGDLETYSGIFNGKPENFQFFFSGGKLRRIGVYLYEGKDMQVAAVEWSTLSSVMTREFGVIDTADKISPSDPTFVATALRIVGESGETQMAPITQPKDASVFSSFLGHNVDGVVWYNVILYFDSPT